MRGRERSRHPKDILEEVEQLAKENGIDYNGINSFATLLRTINKIEGIERIRFVSPHPKDFTDDVIDAYMFIYSRRVGTPGDKIEKSGLCTVEVYTRGKQIGKPVKVYSSKEENERLPTARIALEEYRKSEAQAVLVTARTRLAKLRDGFIKRNANEAEMKHLDELEGVIDNQIEK